MATRKRPRATDPIGDHVATLRAQLEAQANPARAVQEKRYLKSEIEFLGVGMPALRKTAKAFARAHELDHDALLQLSAALWEHEVHELRTLAVAILELKQKQLSAADLPAIISLVRTAKTWALVDWLATKVIGPLSDDPKARKQIDAWARDEDFWVRRTALLAHHDKLLQGAGDFDHFARLAKPMLDEREFFIRKAIGWVLRSTAKRTPQRTYAFVEKHAGQLSGLSFREAVRALPPAQQKKLLALREKA
jgi:3-methyladenine DNA glycosylase AlkD